jgi:hypothetical protein
MDPVDAGAQIGAFQDVVLPADLGQPCGGGRLEPDECTEAARLVRQFEQLFVVSEVERGLADPTTPVARGSTAAPRPRRRWGGGDGVVR